MEWLFGLGLFLSLCFGGVLLVGAPYLPALTPQVITALRLLDLKPGQSLLEIGSGDGKVLLAAAKQGIRVYGIELNPLLVIVSLWRTRQYRKLVTIYWGDVWHKKWPVTDAIYVFGLDRVVEKLHTKIVQNCHTSIRVASVGFPIQSAELTREENGVFLYIISPRKP